MAKSGWCIGPPGAKIHHEQCRSLICSCDCEHAWRKRAESPKVRGSEAISVGPMCDNESAPEGAGNTASGADPLPLTQNERG